MKYIDITGALVWFALAIAVLFGEDAPKYAQTVGFALAACFFASQAFKAPLE